MKIRRFGPVMVAATLGAIVAGAVALATHEDGHTSASGTVLKEVKVVRHSFPVTDYPGGQWVTSSDTWVNVPGARTTVRVPDGERALIIVRFSPSVICEGTGICEARVLIGDKRGAPDKPVYFNPGNWGVVYTERSRGPVGPGRYTVQGQVLTTYGLTGTTLYVRSFHMTVERFAA